MCLHSSIAGVLLSCIFVLTMLVSGVAAQDEEIENILPNPDFEEGIGEWSIGAQWGTLSIDKREDSPTGHPVMLATINAVGVEAWEPEIHSPPFPLENGKTYTYAFWAKAEPDSRRSLGPSFEQLDTWVGMGQGISLTDEWKEYHFTGVWTDPSSPPAVVIHIGFNFQTDDVWFSHFRVYEGEYVEEALENIPPRAVTPVARLTTAWGKIKSR